ncbi:MAG: hypothetical protein WD029_05980 [Microthrixaceae bacterium]
MFDELLTESHLIPASIIPPVRAPSVEPKDSPPVIAVDVWCAYSQRWVTGFRLHETLSDGTLILLGRDSEALLPAAFSPESVRVAGAEPQSFLLGR